MVSMTAAARLIPLLAALLWAGVSAATLSNGRLTLEFDNRGVSAIAGHRFKTDRFSITIDGHAYDSAALGVPSRKLEPHRIIDTYTAGPFEVDVIYELRSDWDFLSKQLVLSRAPAGRVRINDMEIFADELAEPVREAYVIHRPRARLGTKDYGLALRFDTSSGILAAAQNPFLDARHDGNKFSIRYKPDLEWNMSWGPFESDRGLLAPTRLSGRRLPDRMLEEWKLGPGDAAPGLDESEVSAFTGMVRAFLLYRPVRPLNIMIGWCANDYQIDVATPEGRAEYKRIMDSAAALGADHLLFAPANSDVSRREDSTDDWGWEYTLWLGMGEKIRKNEWDAATGPIPNSVQEMLSYARSKKLGLLAYVYPVLGFGGKRKRSNLGDHAFQDWLIGALEGFYRHTGISGYSFDHTFLNYEGASQYAQWWGWRRVMEALRRDIPAIVIDGRQAYQEYGPWIWLAGSYPHPTSTDEQPESFISFPDLKIDRVSADRERYTAYRYRNYEFAPSEIVPGFITHQTPRSADTGYMPEARTRTGMTLLPFRKRDWDYLGWRYSLLSSIAIAGWNNVLDMIPARDVEEFRNFSAADKSWFRHWIDWTNENREYLRHTRPILGQPAVGKIDGTAAMIDGRGYVFLFNPNGRRTSATLDLSSSLVRELYPLEGRLIRFPDNTITLDGGSAMVLRVDPAPKEIREPMLFNAPGGATLENGVLRLAGVRGEVGTREELVVAVPPGSRVDSVTVNGSQPRFSRKADTISIPVTFAGEPFRHYQQVDPGKPLRIPSRIFQQLAARRAAWPIPWTSEDERSTWLAPQRLLLYLQFAEPDDSWDVRLSIDGRPVDLLKAYASVRRVPHNFTGFYADISLLTPDRDYKLDLTLPPGLMKGQFQGVFVENVETEYTAELR